MSSKNSSNSTPQDTVSRPYLVFKRLIDIVISILALPFLVLLTVIIKIAYLCTGDFHTIFYTQDRIGKNGKIFKIYKYRSMVWNAEEKLQELMKTNSKIRNEYTKYKKLIDDPRITKVGKFIRRYSIDEAPQFINLILGNMTLVGNRPYLVTEKKEMGKYYKDIIKTKPGITGLWQVSSHNRMKFEERLKLESVYAECFAYDFGIVLDTFKSLLYGGNN